MTDVVMPRLSDSMEEGTILKWLKGPGEPVKVGEPIAEIETDKATMTYEADAAGFLAPIAAEGDTLAIGAVIARLAESAEAAAADGSATSTPERVDAPAVAATDATATDATATPADESDAATAAAAPSVASDADAVPTPAAPTGASATSTAIEAQPAAATPVDAGQGSAIKASPLARRLARELGVDLAALSGSGPEGRVVKADVLAAHEASPTAPSTPAAVPASAMGDAGSAKGAVEVIEPTRIQALIARRMASAKATIPEFQVTVEVDAEAAFDLREQLRGSTEPVPSVNDLVIKACGLALRAHPRVNGAYVDGHYERYGRVNIGMAVAGDGSLVVPTVFDADVKSLVEIAKATRLLAARVRDGSISPPELAGGTFTVSNLGMFGVARFTAVINPPQAAILAVGAALARAVVGADGTVTSRRIMELTISADHRIVYGADAADFLGTVRRRLERPASLLL